MMQSPPVCLIYITTPPSSKKLLKIFQEIETPKLLGRTHDLRAGIGNDQHYCTFDFLYNINYSYVEIKLCE